MRNIALIITFMLALGLSSYGQVKYEAFTRDTLTNTATKTYTFAERMDQDGTLEYFVHIDSLSGTPGAIIYYDYSLSRSPGANDWYSVSTDTVTAIGASTKQQHKVSNSTGIRARIRIVGSTTQSLGVETSIAFKPAR